GQGGRRAAAVPGPDPGVRRHARRRRRAAGVLPQGPRRRRAGLGPRVGPVGVDGGVRGELPVSLPRLRAPAADGAVLAHPPLADLGRRIDRNRDLLSASRVIICGTPLAELRRLAVAEAAAAARAYLA